VFAKNTSSLNSSTSLKEHVIEGEKKKKKNKKKEVRYEKGKNSLAGTIDYRCADGKKIVE
jgi:hypothetical protein